MKAAVFHELGKPLVIEDVPQPQAGPGELVIRVHYCGICGSDLHATAAGVFVAPAGTVLGHEFAGEVVEANAPGWSVGQAATAIPNNACGDCRALGFGACRLDLGMLCPNNAITGFSPAVPGAYAEYIKVNAAEALPLPEGVGTRDGATVEPLAVGAHAVERGNVRIGSRVLILGAGPIGLAVALFARLAGARDVVVSEYAWARREAAGRIGASAVIDPAAEDPGAAFVRFAGAPPDIIFECVGVPGMIQKCIDMSGPRGKIVVVGVCMVEDTLVPISATFKAVNVQFVLGYDKANWRVVLDLLERGRIDPAPMVTDTIRLAELPQAFEALRKPTSQIKVLVQPT